MTYAHQVGFVNSQMGQQLLKIWLMQLQRDRLSSRVTLPLASGIVAKQAISLWKRRHLAAPVHCSLGSAVQKNNDGIGRVNSVGPIEDFAVVTGWEVRHCPVLVGKLFGDSSRLSGNMPLRYWRCQVSGVRCQRCRRPPSRPFWSETKFSLRGCPPTLFLPVCCVLVLCFWHLTPDTWNLLHLLFASINRWRPNIEIWINYFI